MALVYINESTEPRELKTAWQSTRRVVFEDDACMPTNNHGYDIMDYSWNDEFTTSSSVPNRILVWDIKVYLSYNFT